MFADDIVDMSETPHGLHENLKTSAVSTTYRMVETLICKLRGTAMFR